MLLRKVTRSLLQNVPEQSTPICETADFKIKLKELDEPLQGVKIIRIVSPNKGEEKSAYEKHIKPYGSFF